MGVQMSKEALDAFNKNLRSVGEPEMTMEQADALLARQDKEMQFVMSEVAKLVGATKANFDITSPEVLSYINLTVLQMIEEGVDQGDPESEMYATTILHGWRLFKKRHIKTFRGR